MQASGDVAACVLPDGVLLRVLQHLDLLGLATAGSVCKQWHGVAGADGLWSRVLEHEYGAFARAQAPAAAGGSRRRLEQLRTSSLWHAGRAHHRHASTQGARCQRVWSAAWARAAPPAAAQAPEGSRSQAPGVGVLHHLPAAFAVTAAAAGPCGGVLLGCNGAVLDSHAHTTLAPQQTEADEEGVLVGEGLHWEQLRWDRQQQPHMAELARQRRAQQLPPAAGFVARNLHAFSSTPIISVAAGSQHVLALAASGAVFGWGCNNSGQLGLGTGTLHLPTDITAVADAIHREARVCENGMGWWVGGWFVASRRHWQAQPLGACVHTNPTPLPCASDCAQAPADPFVGVACGPSHSVLLTAAGAVCTAGCNKSGQCGQGLELQQVGGASGVACCSCAGSTAVSHGADTLLAPTACCCCCCLCHTVPRLLPAAHVGPPAGAAA